MSDDVLGEGVSRMNTDIRISTDFPTHPKTIMLQDRLGLPAVWALVCLWIFAAKHRPDGVLRGMTPDALRIACGYAGDIQELMRVLKEPETRFLDADTSDGWIVLHDWKEHNPWAFSSPERSAKSKIAALVKHGKHSEAEALRKALRLGCAAHAKRTAKRSAPSPSPFPSPSPSPSPSPNTESLSGKPDEKIPFGEIIEDLNAKTGKQYKHTTKSTQSLIRARWNDGHRLDDFKKVHSNMSAKWMTDQKMQSYLRPETLYSPKFESYLNEKVSAPIAGGGVDTRTEEEIKRDRRKLFGLDAQG